LGLFAKRTYDSDFVLGSDGMMPSSFNHIRPKVLINE